MVEGGGAVVDWGGVRCFAAAPVSDDGSIVAPGDGRASDAGACDRRTSCHAAGGGGAVASAADAGAALAAAEGRVVDEDADAVVEGVDAAGSACASGAWAALGTSVFPSAAAVTAGGGKGRGFPARVAARFALRRPALLTGLDGRGGAAAWLCFAAAAALRVCCAGAGP